MEKLENYINGKLIAPLKGKYIDNYHPASGKVYSLIPDSDAADVQLAVDAAKAAFPAWSVTPTEKRSKIMMKIASIIERDMKMFVEAESKDNGKSVHTAGMVDIPRAVSNMEFFATAIMHYAAESHIMEDTAINYTMRSPIGVVGCISPWNLPLYLFTWKIAPAIAAGNCVVAKPSEVTPMTAYLFSKACIEAGLPAGVLNFHWSSAEKIRTSFSLIAILRTCSKQQCNLHSQTREKSVFAVHAFLSSARFTKSSKPHSLNACHN
jgi:aminomuconate-semialdehyde/2-hydroxymuconate-6-semialdehyde dehydrogenase